MRIGVLGTGQVGGTLGRKLAELGHDVMLGSRSPTGDKAQALASSAGVAVGTYAEAGAHGEWLVNALPGEHAIALLRDCAIEGKILIDISNYNSAVDGPIETPVGEAIQGAFPQARVVKTLNSVSAHLMVDPASLGAEHHVFLAGNEAVAKRDVEALLRSFGWRSILDLGDIKACRAMEQLIPLWMRLEETLGGPDFNLAVVSHQQPQTE